MTVKALIRLRRAAARTGASDSYTAPRVMERDAMSRELDRILGDVVSRSERGRSRSSGCSPNNIQVVLLIHVLDAKGRPARSSEKRSPPRRLLSVSVHSCQRVGRPPNDVQREQTQMSETPVRDDTAHIYCREETRERVRTLKRGGETYNELIHRMADQYDPDAAQEQEGRR